MNTDEQNVLEALVPVRAHYRAGESATTALASGDNYTFIFRTDGSDNDVITIGLDEPDEVLLHIDGEDVELTDAKTVLNIIAGADYRGRVAPPPSRSKRFRIKVESGQFHPGIGIG